MPAKSVFISHSSKDDPFVRELRQTLEGLGVETWTDSERLTGGDLLSPKLKSAIEKADYFLPVISLDSLNSTWVQKEIEHAKSVRKDDYKIIPLMRPGIGTPILHLLFNEEPIAIQVGDGPAALTHSLPAILAALSLQLPTEIVQKVQVQSRPLADLVLELNDLKISDLNGARRASAVAKLTYIPPDGSREVESKRYSFVAPLGPIEAEELTWYLERYVNWPRGIFDDRARRVVESLPQWGRLLYDSVNVASAREPLEAWKRVTETERRFSVKVDKELIEGTAPDKQNEASETATILLALPWELIHDEQGYLFQGKRPVRVRRSLPNRNQQAALATKPPIRVLLVSPRPEDESAAYIDHRESARPIVTALSQLGKLAEFKLLEPPTFPALEAELERAAKAGEPYHVIHFDGHGVYDRKHGLGKLCFEDPADDSKLEKRRSKLIGADDIASVVREHRIPLFFLDACQTAQSATDPGASVAGKLLNSGVSSVAAMSHSVLVETAHRFVAEFYKKLMIGERVGGAMLAGQRVLKADTYRGESFTGEIHLHDWFVPVLFQEEQDPVLIRDVPAQQVEDVIASQGEKALGELPKLSHDFLGRSRDLLKAERLLLKERYLVVLGSGGEGKTTFASELARWLVATRRFERVAFTSVEQVTEPRQVLFSIGEQLVPNFDSAVGTDDALGVQYVQRALREHKTLLVIDNMESILSDSMTLVDEILKLCASLNKGGQTRLIFTSRESLPEPFHKNVLKIGRLDRDTAIRLLSNLLPNAPESDETEDDLRNLVEAVGGHARSLVLISKEVGLSGVRHATENLREVMQTIDAKHPGQRENSLLASGELSLRRLSPEIRQLIRPLTVFQGGGGFLSIARALKLDADQFGAMARALIDVGLAEYVMPQYLRFDPALLAVDLSKEEREAATAAWTEAITAEIGYLYGQQFEDSNLANNLTLLELANFLAALVYLFRSDEPERVVNITTCLESLVASLNYPRILSRIVDIRNSAAQRLPHRSHAKYLTARASIERLLEKGQVTEAVRAAQDLYTKAEGAGETGYPGAAYDNAMSEFTLGRALRLNGNAAAAIAHLENSEQRFETLNEHVMASTAQIDKADCLTDLGRYDEAAIAYERSIKTAEYRDDLRNVAVGKTQLANVRILQQNYPEALRLSSEARETFEQLNEPASVAATWHQTGIVFQSDGRFEAAEQAYQKALRLKIEIYDRAGQAVTLAMLGNLYSAIERREDAVRLYRQALEIFVYFKDPRKEGLARTATAIQLNRLGRHDEARAEIERAVECQKPFGHVAEPWKTFDIVCDIERALGNEAAALIAREQAMEAYLAYRRDGGAAPIDNSKIIALVDQDSPAARDALQDTTLSYGAAAEIIFALESVSKAPA